MRIARWIAGNICDRGTRQGKDELDCFALRDGKSGARARLFVKMCEIAGISARVFNLYNFGGIGLGHTATQDWNDNKWHYFDVTYVGVFKNDKKFHH